MDEHLKDLEQRLDAFDKKFEVRFKSMEDRFDQRFKSLEDAFAKLTEVVTNSQRPQGREDDQTMLEGRTTNAPDVQKQWNDDSHFSDPSDDGDPDDDFNGDDSDVPSASESGEDENGLNAEIDETDVVVLKEALESAEHKNRKILIIAPELFDESPKKEELKEEKLDIGLDIDEVVSAIGPWIKLVWLELHNMKSEANNVREMSVLIFDPGGLSFVSEMVFVRAVHETKWMSTMEISIYNSSFGPVVSSLTGYEEGAPDTWRLMKAHGTAVGLPTDDDMGNSEVGHNALGAGRIFAQVAKLGDLALESCKIFEGDDFKYIKESFGSGTSHLVGLLSDGGVDSRLD